MDIGEITAWSVAVTAALTTVWKFWSEHQTLKQSLIKESSAVSVTEGESLFKRASEMMDRLENENKDLRLRLDAMEEEIQTLRDTFEDEIEGYRNLLREHNIIMPRQKTIKKE